MADIKLMNVYKKYDGCDDYSVKNFNLVTNGEEFIVFVGPSGCGKTTTLRMIAGLEGITKGEIYIGDKLVNDLEAKNRDISMVFQNYALYPHMTVYDNMAFSLRQRKFRVEEKGRIIYRKYNDDEIDKKVQEAASILNLTQLLDRKPKELSGGEKQRVALGRSIVRKPKVFLMDEPLSNLDAQLRTQTRVELLKLHEELKTTFVYVTHDQIEAMTMGDRIVVMNKGEIQQIDSPINIFNHPSNIFVAKFIGSPSMNLLPGKLSVRQENMRVTINIDEQSYVFELPEMLKYVTYLECGEYDIIIGIRPEHVKIADENENGLDMQIVITEMMGSETYVHCRIKEDTFVLRTSSLQKSISGEIRIKFDINQVHLFNKKTGLNLR